MPDIKLVIEMICGGLVYLYVHFSVGHVQCSFVVERQIEREIQFPIHRTSC